MAIWAIAGVACVPLRCQFGRLGRLNEAARLNTQQVNRLPSHGLSKIAQRSGFLVLPEHYGAASFPIETSRFASALPEEEVAFQIRNTAFEAVPRAGVTTML